MDRGRISSKHVKKRPKKSSKKTKKDRRRSRDGTRYGSSNLLKTEYQNYKIVEYSDVSSEEFSAPEAGEIEDEEILSLSDQEGYSNSKNGNNSTGNNRLHIKSDHINSVKSTKKEFDVSRLDFVMSPREVRKVIIGSPISSSISSNSRSKLRHSPSPAKNATTIVSNPASPIDEELEVDELDENEELIEEDDELEEERRRRKNKKSKKKKNKKKKKKRRKSISSAESISDNESLLDDAAHPITPPQPESPEWEQTYTPVKPSPMSPATPPIRPNSNASMYSEKSTRRISPASLSHNSNTKSMYVASPHTPPLVQKKSSYHSPIDADLNHSHHGHHYHHSHHHHHQPRSPIDPPPSSRRISKSPRKFSIAFIKVIQN